MQMGPKWEDAAWQVLELVSFRQVITKSRMGTYKLTFQIGRYWERNCFSFQGINPNKSTAAAAVSQTSCRNSYVFVSWSNRPTPARLLCYTHTIFLCTVCSNNLGHDFSMIF